MNKSVFFLVSLYVIAFCSTSRVVSYNGMIDKLVELNEAAGKDKNDIGILVSQVSSASKENNEKFDSFFSGLSTRCQKGKGKLADYIKGLASDKLSITVRSNQAKDDNKKIEDDRVKLTATLAKDQAALKALRTQVDTEIENFRIYAAEAEAKLVIIKTLRDIITDELVNPTAEAQAFVQLATFSDKVHELKTLLENSKDNEYVPLVSTLLSLAEGKGFSDQKVLGQILAVLGKLETNLRAFRLKQNTDGKVNIQNLRDQSKQKKIQILASAKLVAEANSTHQDNLNLIAASDKDVITIEKDSERKVKEADYWTKICNYQDGVNKTETTFRSAFDLKVKAVTVKLLDLK